ncbi:hypothetical protein CXB51_005302 [Gossypium anomalum]|uniref:Uncharacterized protein n=1 Tax=Gossypium anomalum TaxID=47600 RepID=A0A8J5Z0W3_9ROSI|nr:hypothetical protein CXB51_005302 [Gossypium anomalum]
MMVELCAETIKYREFDPNCSTGWLYGDIVIMDLYFVVQLAQESRIVEDLPTLSIFWSWEFYLHSPGRVFGRLRVFSKMDFVEEWVEGIKSQSGTMFGFWGSRNWKDKTDQADVAQKIMQIPLAATDHKDFQVWKGELSGKYSLPLKVTITIWKISWDFIPHLANLRYRESSQLTDVLAATTGLKMVSTFFANPISIERKHTTRTDLAKRIHRHMEEYEGMRATKIPLNTNNIYKKQADIPRIIVQFDAAFDSRNFKSATGLVVWGLRGNYWPQDRYFTITSPLHLQQKHMHVVKPQN